MENQKTIKEAIQEMMKRPELIEDMRFKYRNAVEISGWVIRKPKFIKHDKTGVESCSLLLYQLTQKGTYLVIDSYCVMVYVKDLIEQLKDNKNIIFVACVGLIRHNKRFGDYVQVVEMATLAELPFELAMETEKKQ